MKIFISWSGIRSKEIAEILRAWLRQTIQAVEPWVSLDIEKGERWNEKIIKELEQTKFGIICLTSDNLTSEWLLFEAGALAKTSDSNVCTFLFDLNSADIKPPLGQFQHTLNNEEDIKKLLFTINNKLKKCEEKYLSESDLEDLFNLHWPNLKSKLENVSNKLENSVQRSDRSILEEILHEVRGLSYSREINDWFSIFHKKYEQDHNIYLNKLVYENFWDSILSHLKSNKNKKDEDPDTLDVSKTI